MDITAQIIADSINPKGCRLTTWILEYPRFIHSELMTHRMFSKNAASSRAIPIETMIERVLDDPAMPVWWGKNQSGMQAKEELSENETIRVEGPLGTEYHSPRGMAKEEWLRARDSAVEAVRTLSRIGCHKQISNRILEPWTHIRVILSGTEYENFFALRAHPDAQPEFQALAYKMLEAYNASEPKALKPGEWHVPFGDQIDQTRLVNLIQKDPRVDMGSTGAYGEEYIGNWSCENVMKWKLEYSIKIAIARCARISYLNFEGKDDYATDIKLCDRLFGSVPRHLSPTEHVAQCLDDDLFHANFRGWKQYRLTFDDQNLRDPRVARKGGAL